MGKFSCNLAKYACIFHPSFCHGKKLDQNKTTEHKTFGFGSVARQKKYIAFRNREI
tara:strand:+ start:2031 stop:2198 length:168 start_codon:yes stop_codon:yes gene_type:complete